LLAEELGTDDVWAETKQPNLKKLANGFLPEFQIK
jgi:hypothetical protein